MVAPDTHDNEYGSPKVAFISHSSQDFDLAKQLCDFLEYRGIPCWIAPRDVILGKPYAEAISLGIEVSDSLILLGSAVAISSIQVLSEVEQAHKRKKAIYTVLIGKLQVNRELDFYISRLHWIASGSLPIEEIADKLAAVLGGLKKWTEVASPPSFVRTVLYRRDAFQGAALATLLVLLLAAGGLWAWVQWRLDLDYRRLGYVSPSAIRMQEPDGGRDRLRIQAQVWLLAKGVRFGKVRFLTAMQRTEGGIERSDRSEWMAPEQIGSTEVVDLAAPLSTRTLTTCLIVPSPGLHGAYRVTQEFAVRVGNPEEGQVFISPMAEPRVGKEDGEQCGPTN